MITRKVCLLGAFAVGKTSLVRRFVEGVFDERYISTLGVKIDTKTVETEAGAVKLIVWDMEGADPTDPSAALVNDRMGAYLQGADGVLLVFDGTRPATAETAAQLTEWLHDAHPGIPVVVLANKFDLCEQWQIDDRALNDWPQPVQTFTTSALSGANVETAFSHLARHLIGDT